MHSNGEMPQTKFGHDRLEPLQLARRSLMNGRTGEAFGFLERVAGLVPDDLRGWMGFLVPAVILAGLYERQYLAFRWIERTVRKVRQLRSTGSSIDDLLSEIDLLKLRVQFTERGVLGIEARLEKAFSRINDWKPWMVEFRWLFLLNLRRFDELEDLLRHPPRCKIESGTLEYATRLYCLGLRFTVDLRIRPALILLHSALRKLEECPLPEALYHKCMTLFWMARLETEKGRFVEAFQLAKDADTLAWRLKLHRVRHFRSFTYGHIYYRLGDYEKAARVSLANCLSVKPRSTYDLTNTIPALLHAAKCSLALNRLRQSRKLLSRAAAMIKNYPLASWQGYLHLLRGDLNRESGTPAGYRAARRCYRIAEKFFRNNYSEHEWWLCQLHLSRAALYLKEKNIDEVLRQASLGMDLGKNGSYPHLQAEVLLLKSFLLLEKEAPRAELYETILRNLGVVKEPVVLFKILANLYIYSWDLGDQLELTDLHLKQIERLRENIPARLYQRLYQTYVTERVVARFKSRFACSEAGQSRPASG